MTHSAIVAEILTHLRETNPLAAEAELPLDESLYALGILDSFGVVEMVDYLERRWAVRIHDGEITTEKFGSINKMARLVEEKLDAR